MIPVIPFISEVSGGERKAWRDALPKALAGIAEVKPFDDLSQKEKEAAKVAIVANPDPQKVAALPNLVWVQSLWAGVERLTVELPVDGPEIVRLTDPQLAETMSEAVLAWTLYLHRDMPTYMSQQRGKTWHAHALELPQDQTVAVLGIGKLGSASAIRLKNNGFNVIGWSRNLKDIDGIPTYSGIDGLVEVLGKADFIVLLMPLTPETRGLFNREVFAAMKQGASLINFARGQIIDDPALLKSLDAGHLKHAVLDVFNQEPLPADHPFWDHSQITILPHISAPTITSTASKIVADNIGRYLRTGEIPQTVDRQKGY